MSQLMTVAPKYQALLDANTPKRTVGISAPAAGQTYTAGAAVALSVEGASVSVRSPHAGAVSVRLFDLGGRMVATLHEGPMSAGQTMRFTIGGRLGRTTTVVEAKNAHGCAVKKVAGKSGR